MGCWREVLYRYEYYIDMRCYIRLSIRIYERNLLAGSHGSHLLKSFYRAEDCLSKAFWGKLNSMNLSNLIWEKKNPFQLISFKAYLLILPICATFRRASQEAFTAPPEQSGIQFLDFSLYLNFFGVQNLGLWESKHHTGLLANERLYCKWTPLFAGDASPYAPYAHNQLHCHSPDTIRLTDWCWHEYHCTNIIVPFSIIGAQVPGLWVKVSLPAYSVSWSILPSEVSGPSVVFAFGVPANSPVQQASDSHRTVTVAHTWLVNTSSSVN